MECWGKEEGEWFLLASVTVAATAIVAARAVTVVRATVIFKVLERTQKQEQQVCTRSWGATQAAVSQQKQPQWHSVHGLWVKSFSLLPPSSRCGNSLVQLPIFG